MTGCLHPQDDAIVLFEARDYITGDRFEVARCGVCQLVRTIPGPTAANLAAYYPAGYYGDPGLRRYPAAVEFLQQRLYARRARSVERLIGRAGRVLDVGCGRGFLLDAFRRRGWQVQGTELDERSATYAREVLGIPVHVGPQGLEPWGEEEFDAVVLWHVLEHLSDPAEALAQAARTLRPGGVLMVGVPNLASVEARLTGSGWFHLDVPRHLLHFEPRWLEAAFDDVGLEVRKRSFFAPEFDAFSMVQSVENRLGLPVNLLYELLRGRGAKLLDRTAGTRLQAAAAVLLAVPIGLLSVPAIALFTAARRGSSVTFLAVKRDEAISSRTRLAPPRAA